MPASPASTEIEFPSLPDKTRPDPQAPETPDKRDGPESLAPHPAGGAAASSEKTNAWVPPRLERPNLQL